MKTPTDCDSLSDVRLALDHVDQQIIALFGLRADYLRAAARFPTSQSTVTNPQWVAAMLETRRRWSQQEKLDPAFIERLYRDLLPPFSANL